MTEREIDTAIDRAVRDLMDVDADAAFRARVTARLQRPARRLLLRPLAAAALTAAAIAACGRLDATVRAWRAGVHAGGGSAVRPAAPARPGCGIGSRPLPAEHRSPDAARAPRTAAGPIPRGALSRPLRTHPASTIAPLTAIDPIDVEPISQAPIAPTGDRRGAVVAHFRSADFTTGAAHRRGIEESCRDTPSAPH